MSTQRLLSLALVVVLLGLAGCAGTSSTQPTATSQSGAAAPETGTTEPAQAAAPTTAAGVATRAPAGPSATLVPVTPLPAMRQGDINLAHLNFLTEPVQINGQDMAIVHIYSESPKYDWVDASGEGIAALDDVARAALVYLAYFEHTKDSLALEQARRLLNFTVYMQAEDGEYYNFVLDRAGTINRDGLTSYKSWGWWAARGQWALAAGYRVFKELDPTYAGLLQSHYLMGEEALASKLSPPGTYNELHGTRVPGWLLGEGSDVSALAVLGLAEYQAVAPNDHTKGLLLSLGDAIAAYQLGGPADYPFAAHPSSATSTALWHAWGSHQCHALASAGLLLEQPAWIESARREADIFYGHLLASDFLNQMAVTPVRAGQIAYGQQTLVSCFQALAVATGNQTYLQYAGLAAGWFFGNNMARVAMYDPATGRGYDGIQGPSEFRVNRNSGAESTIEALYTLMKVADDPVASRYLRYRPDSVETPYRLIEAEDGQPAPGKPAPEYGRRNSTGEADFSGGHYYDMPAGAQVQVAVTFPTEADYYLYVAHLRQASPQPGKSAEALRTQDPIKLDGDLTEWQAAAPVKVDTKENILRGASQWEGPETASFVAYFLWDDQNLYIAAAVQAPGHRQIMTGAEVWKGDTLLVYLDTKHQGSSVDQKFTLAQTPDGPQVWNWKGGGFLAEAQMAWKQTASGYNYEAAIPWKSLYVDDVGDGKVLGFDLGRGFGGSGFQNFTGKDPDTASNLAPLKLVTALSPATQSAAGGQPRAADAGIADAGIADAVALRVWFESADSPSLDPWFLPESVAPDRDYLWLDRLTARPFHHAAGDALLTFESAGSNPSRSSVVDAFLLQPVVERKVFTDDAGRTLTVVHSLETGETSLSEK